MTVKIFIHYYDSKYLSLKDLVDDFKSKNLTVIEETTFGIDFKLNVKSFDEVIHLLEKYSREIKIELSIYTDEIRLFVSKEIIDLGNQVE